MIQAPKCNVCNFKHWSWEPHYQDSQPEPEEQTNAAEPAEPVPDTPDPKPRPKVKKRVSWIAQAAEELGLPEDDPMVKRRARSLSTMASRNRNKTSQKKYRKAQSQRMSAKYREDPEHREKQRARSRERYHEQKGGPA